MERKTSVHTSEAVLFMSMSRPRDGGLRKISISSSRAVKWYKRYLNGGNLSINLRYFLRETPSLGWRVRSESRPQQQDRAARRIELC